MGWSQNSGPQKWWCPTLASILNHPKKGSLKKGKLLSGHIHPLRREARCWLFILSLEERSHLSFIHKLTIYDCFQPTICEPSTSLMLAKTSILVIIMLVKGNQEKDATTHCPPPKKNEREEHGHLLCCLMFMSFVCLCLFCLR